MEIVQVYSKDVVQVYSKDEENSKIHKITKIAECDQRMQEIEKKINISH